MLQAQKIDVLKFLSSTILSLSIALILATPTTAQFEGAKVHDWGIVGGALTARVIYTIKKSKFETSTPFRGRGIPDIFWFDRNTIGNSSYKAAHVSDGFLYTSIGGMTFGGIHAKQGWYLGLQTMAVTDLTNLLLKNIVRRRRPFTYSASTEDLDLTNCKKYDAHDYDASLSFYSGHTAQVAAFSYFTLSMLYYTSSSFQDGGNDWAYVVGGTIPAITAYLRIRAGKHFPTDVAVGYLAGAAAGYLIPKWHRDKSKVGSTSKFDDKMGIALLSGAGSGILLALAAKIAGKPKHNCIPGESDATSKQASKVNFSIKPHVGVSSGLRMTLQF